MKSKHSNENKNSDNFELELFNSLKYYGYLFPENKQEVETFEALYGTTEISTPLNILPKTKDENKIISFDFSLFNNIAAFKNDQENLFKFPDDKKDSE